MNYRRSLMHLLAFLLSIGILLCISGCSGGGSSGGGTAYSGGSGGTSFPSPAPTPAPSPTGTPSPSPSPLPADLIFHADSGVRVYDAANPIPYVDSSGTIFLYYSSTGNPPGQKITSSSDGLVFPPGANPQDSDHDARRHLLPDGTWRLYQYDQVAQVMKSMSSKDGKIFTSDPGSRYAPQPNDRNSIGVYDHYNDKQGGVVLLYIGDMTGLNNIRMAYSLPGDNGWSFSFDHGNVLGDDNAGGGPNSYVDPKSLLLPDGRRRLFTMKQGTDHRNTIYSFISSDGGRTYALEPGTRLTFSHFTEFQVVSLNDPWVVHLPDGRYRMYVATLIQDGSSGSKRAAIVSATTR